MAMLCCGASDTGAVIQIFRYLPVDPSTSPACHAVPAGGVALMSPGDAVSWDRFWTEMSVVGPGLSATGNFSLGLVIFSVRFWDELTGTVSGVIAYVSCVITAPFRFRAAGRAA